MKRLKRFARRLRNPDFRRYHVESWDWETRRRNVLLDPDNEFIPRVPDAGKIVNGVCRMHNGVRVYAEYYCPKHFEIITANRGVHEPQEERVFAEVLRDLNSGASMLELGSYWAFYSLWFAAQIPGARNWMIEPDAANLELGRKNFALNSRLGVFFQAAISSAVKPGTPPSTTVDAFLREQNIDRIDILHADLQGAELKMLQGAREALGARCVRYLFVSTHTNTLHKECRAFLEALNYEIIASADLYESFCFDGVLVACARELARVPKISISNRKMWRPRRR
jgi:hypothetical protein